MLKRKSAILYLTLGLGLSNLPTEAAIVDQTTLRYVANGGLSALGLSNYNYWETFTAGITGTLVQVDLAFYNGISHDASLTGTGEFQILSGAPPFGALLYSTDVVVNAPGIAATSYGTLNSFSVNTRVLAGETYSFQFTPIDMPSVFGLPIEVGNPSDPAHFYPLYPGGNAGQTDPSGVHPFRYNFVFETFVLPAVPEPSTLFLTILAIPFLLGLRMRRKFWRVTASQTLHFGHFRRVLRRHTSKGVTA